MRYISKKASEEALKEKTFEFWDTSKGPLENLLGWARFAVPFIPGLGWTAFIIELVADKVFGFGADEFGAYLDKLLGFGPGTELTEAKLEQALKMQEENLLKSSSVNHQLVKEAFLGIGLKMMTGKLIGAIKTLFKALLKVLGVSAIGVSVMNSGKLDGDKKQDRESKKETDKLKETLELIRS